MKHSTMNVPHCGAGLNAGLVRLVGGGADEGGAWEYGRLEVFINREFTVVGERRSGDTVGRLAAQVACRSLGYATGAQLLVGASSPFPAPPGSTTLINVIACDGSEANLFDCGLNIPDYSFRGDYDVDVQPFTASLICTNPSGVLRCPSVVRSCPAVRPTETLHFQGAVVARVASSKRSRKRRMPKFVLKSALLKKCVDESQLRGRVLQAILGLHIPGFCYELRSQRFGTRKTQTPTACLGSKNVNRTRQRRVLNRSYLERHWDLFTRDRYLIKDLGHFYACTYPTPLQ